MFRKRPGEPPPDLPYRISVPADIHFRLLDDGRYELTVPVCCPVVVSDETFALPETTLRKLMTFMQHIVPKHLSDAKRMVEDPKGRTVVIVDDGPTLRFRCER